MIKLKNMLIKEEVDKKKLKNAIKNVAEANVVLIKALSEFFEIFTRHHGTAQADSIIRTIKRIGRKDD